MTETASFEQMKGAIGSLLFLWADIELALREAITQLDGERTKPAHGIAAALVLWERRVCAQDGERAWIAVLGRQVCMSLQRPLQVRNGLCHGLRGILAAGKDHPGKLIWNLDGQEQEITWPELQKMFDWLSKAPRAISTLTRAMTGPDAKRIAATSLPEADWWTTEFGLAEALRD